jgi:hypothetical protein
VEEPDWNLFHALQSTRAALGDLRDSARQPPPEQAEVVARPGDSGSIPRLNVNGSSIGTRTPGGRTNTLPEVGVHRAMMIARAEGH